MDDRCGRRVRVGRLACELPAGHQGWHQHGRLTWDDGACLTDDEDTEPKGSDDGA